MGKTNLKLEFRGRAGKSTYIPCSTYGLRSVQIPGELNLRDFKAYIARRLPTLFPARSGSCRYDFQCGVGGFCTVFACDLDTVAALVGDIRGLRKSAAIWKMGRSILSDGFRIVVLDEYAEIACIKNTVAVSIQAITEPGQPPELATIIPPLSSVELVCDTEKADDWKIFLTKIGVQDIRHFPVSALAPGPGESGVFSDDGDREMLTKAVPFIRLAVIGIVAILSIGFVRSRYELALERLQDYRSGLASTVIDAGELARRRDALRSELQGYGCRVPSVIAVLEALSTICSHSLIIERFSISDGRFEIWALSGDALAELEAIEGDPRFSRVTVKGIVPGGYGRERFSLLGDYHD